MREYEKMLNPIDVITEADYKKTIIKVALIYGWRVESIPDSRKVYPRETAPGFPDLVLAKAPTLLLVEVKTEHGKLSKQQALWLLELNQCGGVQAFVARPSGWDSLEKLLRGEVLHFVKDSPGSVSIFGT